MEFSKLRSKRLYASTGFGYQVLLGNGDGTFRFRLLPLGEIEGEVAVADFNGDGKAHLAIADGSTRVSIVLGNGEGTFRAVYPLYRAFPASLHGSCRFHVNVTPSIPSS